MSTITVDHKSTGNDFTASDFNQMIDALKVGSRSIKTERVQTENSNGVNEFAGWMTIEKGLTVDGVNFVSELTDLVDVNIIGPANGHVLTYQDDALGAGEAGWKNEAIDGGSF